MLKQSLIAHTSPIARDAQTVVGEGYRITVLSDRLFRVEASKTSSFCDSATQSIWFRDLGEFAFTTSDEGRLLKIKTDKVELCFDKTSLKAKTVTFQGSGKVVRVSNKGNLKGTRRTLDFTAGKVPIGDGVISKTGVAVFTDSSLYLDDKGEIAPRVTDERDDYIFAYGNDYRAAVGDLYGIAGKVPLIPRYALGVWWSRYRAYTQEEYITLMQAFADKGIPLTVATIDMDWHWTDLNTQFGTNYPARVSDNPCTGGWTGYSWNTNLFPDYRAFLTWLQSHGLKVTVNLHPRDGIRWFENMYEDMARAMGIDPATKQDVPFMANNADFWNAYFDIVHKPYEREGVNFWWIDWQQGTKSEQAGLDPLWALNHYHFLDNAENGQLPLILSRFSGLGGHRYPLGFSGDTFIRWSTLKFQPYFTINAANIGYTWWSHDIGGHHFGSRKDELYMRWLQFGVFSPIMRLHSTSSDLLGKEPWLYNGEVESLSIKWLQLRHRLIPYIYTMDYRTHSEGIALLEPIYYAYPDDCGAYECRNEYFFGSQLIVCPITSPASKKTLLASTKIWIPEGRWTDIFTGEIYEGARLVEAFRDLCSIPVLAREGAIIPLSNDCGNSIANPKEMELLIFRGNNSFTLYEDDGTVNFADNNAQTTFTVSESKGITEFTISAAVGKTDVLPDKRGYVLTFKDIKKVRNATVKVDGKVVQTIKNEDVLSENCFSVNIDAVSTSATIKVVISDYATLCNPSFHDGIVEVFSKWQTGFLTKTKAYRKFRRDKDIESCRKKLKHTILPRAVKRALKAKLSEATTEGDVVSQ